MERPDQRTKTRVKLETSANLQFNDRSLAGNTLSRDISLDGIFIRTSEQVPINVPCRVTITISGTSSSLSMQIKASSGTAPGFLKAEQLFSFDWQVSLGDAQLTPDDLQAFEAAHGPIAALQPGDRIDIDLDARTLNVCLTQNELHTRLQSLPTFVSNAHSKWLRRYAHFVTSADTGAVLVD